MLELELGKRYVRRDGQITDPLTASDQTDYPFWDDENVASYNKDGVWQVGKVCELDIMAEYVEDGADEAPYESPIAVKIPEVTPVVDKTPALENQIGGDHYRTMAIQPVEYIMKNNIGFAEGNIIKYVSRWRVKGGVADLKKARHFLDILIENEEGEPK